MKQKLLILALAVTAFACKQNDAPLPEGTVGSYHVVALNDFDFATTKAAIEQNTPLELHANDKVYHLNRYALTDNVNIADGEVSTYTIDGVDSIQIVTDSDNVSFQITDNGQVNGYFAYDTPDKLDEIMQAYQTAIPATKAASMLTKSAGSRSGSINISGLFVEPEGDHDDLVTLTPEEQALSDAEMHLANANTKAVKKNEVIINLMIGKGADRPISHEVGWAAAEIANSVNHLFKGKRDTPPKIVINRLECDFGAGGANYSRTQDSDREYGNFIAWVDKKHKEKAYSGNTIFVLIKQWTYSGGTLGLSLMGQYNINNTARNRNATAISTTCCLYKRVLAHEVGHLFGADHTKTKWYKINYDLMRPTSSLVTKSEFRTDVDGGNYNVYWVYNNLNLK